MAPQGSNYKARAERVPALCVGRRLGICAPAYSLVLTVLVLGPAILPGFVLTYDMVFTPRQSMLPAWLGLDGGLPRAVPQDAIVSLATILVDGAWLQKFVLIATLLVIGVGAARLAERGIMSLAVPSGVPEGTQEMSASLTIFGMRPQLWATSAGLLAATFAMWNPYVAQRLIQGHWSLLLAYGVAFWALRAVMDLRRQGVGARRVVILLGVAAITPFGGLLVLLLVVPAVLFPGGYQTIKQRIGIAAGGLIMNLPWLIPSVVHPLSRFSDPQGTEVFSLRAEGPWGPWVTALGGGGIWNAEVVLTSRGWWTAAVFAVLATGFAILGWRTLKSVAPSSGWDAGVSVWLLTCAIVGFVLAVVPAVAPEVGVWIGQSVPGGGLVRDSSKLLAPWVMTVSVFASIAVVRIAAGWHSRHRDRSLSAALIALALVSPMAVMPDFAWGAQGRLAAVEYPPEWQELRNYLARQPAPGDVLALPWSAFRQYEFNARRTVLDPLPRWLTRSTVTNDELLIARDDDIVAIVGDDPRSQAVSAALSSSTPLSEVLPELGIGWVVLETGQRPEVLEQTLNGLDAVFEAGDFVVYKVPRIMESPGLPVYAGLVIAVDLAVLTMLTVLLGSVGVSGWRRRMRLRVSPDKPRLRTSRTPRGRIY
jgi:hypothetical protein